MIYCDRCGYKNPDNVTHCYKCGAQMTPSQPPSETTPPPPGSPPPPPPSFTLHQPPQPPPPPYTPPQPPPYSPPPPGYGARTPYQQPPTYGGAPPAHVPNHMVMAVLTTILCCLPLGIIAIINAAQVNTKLQAGDYAGAVEASGKAKKWSWWSFGLGLAGTLIYLTIILLGALLGGKN